MFKLSSNKQIGEYLSKLIYEHYDSVRKFGIAYLEENNIHANDESIRNMSNRLSQILNGNKSLQLSDLPTFTKLLGVSCEEILSAGKNFVADSNHLTNYMIAFSNDENMWDKYINHKEKLILNPDEYGKTSIDYALKFKNYNFIKYLINKKYIWFDSRKDNDYIMTFGAGTSIERRHPYRIDDFLQHKIATEDQLRIDIISLAVENSDIKILNELRAREIPELYYKAHYLSCQHHDINSKYDENLVRHISKSNNTIIDYFTDTFEVRDRIKYKDGSKRKHTFMFPFISQLIDFMILDKHKFTDIVLRKAIEHNKKTYENLQQLIENAIKSSKSISAVLKEYDFYENGNIISFRDTFNFNRNGLITNIVNVKNKSEYVDIKPLITTLNSLYYKIVNIKNEFQEKGEI